MKRATKIGLAVLGGATTLALLWSGRDDDADAPDQGPGDEPESEEPESEEPESDGPVEPESDGPIVEPEQGDLPIPYEAYTDAQFTIDLTGLSNGIRYRIWRTAEEPQTEQEKDIVSMEKGIAVDDEEARFSAATWVAAFNENPLPPFPEPDGQGAPAGPPPNGENDGLVPEALVMPPVSDLPQTGGGNGLQIRGDCRAVTVGDVVAWAAWATPIIQLRYQTLSGPELMQQLLNAGLPECDWDLTEIRLADDVPAMQQAEYVEETFLAPMRAGQNLQDEPDKWSSVEQIAALLFGAEPGRVAPYEFPYIGYHVELSGSDGLGWSWAAWPLGKSAGIPSFASEVSQPSWEDAVADAKTKLTENPI